MTGRLVGRGGNAFSYAATFFRYAEPHGVVLYPASLSVVDESTGRLFSERRTDRADLGLAAGVAAHAALSLHRPAVTDPAVVITVRDVVTAAATDPRLDRVLPTVDFDRAKLSDVLRSLADRGGINVVADWATLGEDDVNVHPDTPVTLHLTNVRWSSALDAALLLADPHRKVAWNAQGDVVSVTLATAESVGPVVVRLYDAEPLLEQADRERNRQPPTTAPGGGTFSGNQSGLQTAIIGDDDPSVLDEIKSYLETTVDPNGWRDNGGDIGTISTFGAELIVSQTEQNQRRVAAALQLLVERH